LTIADDVNDEEVNACEATIIAFVDYLLAALLDG